MPKVNDGERVHFKPTSFHRDTPFLTMFAEGGDQWTLEGGYDESADVWVVEGQPLVSSNNFALETTTFTRTGGESQDTD